MNNNFLLTFLISLIVSTCAIASNPYAIKLKSTTILVQAQDDGLALSKAVDFEKTPYAVVQFYSIPNELEKKILQENGLELLEYLPNLSFLCKLDKLTDVSLNFLDIRVIIPYKKEYKLSKFVANGNHPDWAIRPNGRIALMIEPHITVNHLQFKSLLEENGLTISDFDPSFNFYNVILSQNKIGALANLIEVKFIDYIPAPPEKEDERARSLHQSNLLDADHPSGRKYDGTGVSIAIADDGAIGPHIDLTGRVTQYVTFDNGTHGDMTTGIAIGAGNLNPAIKGSAPGAYLHYYNIGGYPHISNAVNNLNNRGVVITSTSYSEGCNAGYTSTTRTVDQQTRQNPELLHVFSAGNSASSNCGGNAYGAGTPWGTITGGRKQGKAVIATGNLDYTGILTNSSSRGPAADGRIKPDICSNGTNQLSTDPNNQYSPGGGTSAAAPGIAGIAAQLYQGYKSLDSGNNPESGLIKSIMLNTARNLGNKGPDFYYGWGMISAHRAMKLIEENRYTDSTILTSGQNIHTINIPNDLLELRFMVYWTDYEASTIAAQALVNDIDIQVVTPNGDTINPWILDPTPNQSNLIAAATRGVDSLNNVEQVLIDSALAGKYEVLVNGTSVPQGPQKYFLSWETKLDEVEVTYPFGGESLVPETFEVIRWDATGSNGRFVIDYSLDSGNTWNNIATTNGNSRYRNWYVPSNITGNAMVKVSRVLGVNNYNVADSSDYTFSIIETPKNIEETFVCFDSIGIRWDSVPGATSYEISMLGSMYMDSIGRSDSNFFVLKKTDYLVDNWVSVKAIGDGIKGRRANAILLPKEIANCSFDTDLSLERIISPNESYIFNCGSSKSPLVIKVKNNGDSSISNIPLEYSINNVTVRDTIFSSISVDSSLSFTFRDSISGILGSINNLEVRGNLLGDKNFTNDSLLYDFAILSRTQGSLPLSYDFDSTNSCSTANDCGRTFCSLSEGWLNMNNSIYDDFDMRVGNNETPSPNTGPINDHTLGTLIGKYIYAEASNSCYEVESHVVSPCINLSGTDQPELSFWYHMNGTSVGSLSVDVYSNGVWTLDVIPVIEGSQGNSWLNEKVNLSSFIGSTITIRFKIKTGDSWSSDIAIDDIIIEDANTSSLDNKINTLTFRMFPNPAKDQVQLRLSEIPEESILIHDINGRLVKQVSARSKNITISISNLKSGIYFLSIDKNNLRKKLIVY